MYTYSIDRPPIILREYGRNIQNLVDYIKSLPDKQTRTAKAYGLIKIMQDVNVQSRGMMDQARKFWDDLFIIAGYELDIDAPYPAPVPAPLRGVMQRGNFSYQHASALRFRQYGRNVELLLHKAVQLSDEGMREQVVAYAMKLMKGFSNGWQSQDGGGFDGIIRDIQIITQGKLVVDFKKLKQMASAALQQGRAPLKGKVYKNSGSAGAKKGYSKPSNKPHYGQI